MLQVLTMIRKLIYQFLFKQVQNKIHYAIHGQTAAEVIYTRADAEKEFMGLMTFAGNQPTLKEAVIAKNYLNEKSFGQWDNLFSWYFDFAERQAEREQVMTMSIGQSIWIVSLQ